MVFKRLTRPIIGWISYDFANSAFATSIMSAIFSVYLTQKLVPPGGAVFFGMTIPAESVWGYLITLVMATVLIVSPSLGHFSDLRAFKRRFLVFFTLVGGFSTLGLFGAEPGRLGFALVAAYAACICYELAQVFYNAFINDVATDDIKGSVSGLGFAVGYLGGGLCLALNMVMITKPHVFGLPAEGTLKFQACFFVVGVWWVLFSIPTFLWVKDVRKENAQAKITLGGAVLGSFHQLKETFLYVRKEKNIGQFLLAYLIYMDGIQTLILMASVYAAKILGLLPAQVALIYLIIQFVAFFGASFFGPLADKWSHKKVVLISLVVFVGVTIWALVMKSAFEFGVMGAVVGLVLGGAQSASRSLYANLIPVEKSGELFGFYTVVAKAAALIGPFIFAFMTQVAGLKPAMGSLMAFFLVGGSIFLVTVKEK